MAKLLANSPRRPHDAICRHWLRWVCVTGSAWLAWFFFSSFFSTSCISDADSARSCSPANLKNDRHFDPRAPLAHMSIRPWGWNLYSTSPSWWLIGQFSHHSVAAPTMSAVTRRQENRRRCREPDAFRSSFWNTWQRSKWVFVSS